MWTGLSYTNFSLSEAQPSAEVAELVELGVGENTTVSLTVANVGAREGDEVIMALFMPHAGTVPEGAPAARLKQQSAPSLFLATDRCSCSYCCSDHRVHGHAHRSPLSSAYNHEPCAVPCTVLLNCTARR